jgi:aminomethyltransferase
MAAAPASATPLRHTSLYEKHVALGARMVPFAGWEMPVRYEGVIAEHNAVRRDAGIFDVSHMGEIETSGPAALELLQRLLSNDLAKVEVGGAQYSVLCREDGGVLDDCFTYRLGPERYLTVTNAANHEQDLGWFIAHRGTHDVEIRNRAEDYAMLAVQGPIAREIVQAIANAPLPKRMRVEERVIDGIEALVCGTGYTGEDGVELLLAPATRCARRSATTFTAMISRVTTGRSRRVSAGAARRTPASSARRGCVRRAAIRRPSSWCRSS